MEKLKYKDTRNFAPIDVTRGVDLVTKQIVMADADAPDDAVIMPKCKFCANFNETDAFMGICTASMNDPDFFAYPDMVAVTCEMFEAL
ncbi:MAG: 4-hydroxyphenylacetate decarboxylase small subunit [Desulfobacter sp.]|nr:MAG: 4-hydroxyphenylacetate decarboxylase small subunit [Desulfobacter sp.]